MFSAFKQALLFAAVEEKNTKEDSLVMLEGEWKSNGRGIFIDRVFVPLKCVLVFLRLGLLMFIAFRLSVRDLVLIIDVNWNVNLCEGVCGIGHESPVLASYFYQFDKNYIDNMFLIYV